MPEIQTNRLSMAGGLQSTNVRRILSSYDVEALVPYSMAQIRRLERAGKFPKRLRLGPCRVGWLADEIAIWIEARAADRDVRHDSHGRGSTR
jgi:prophage regulatory protein